jgi:glutathione S-transferase
MRRLYSHPLSGNAHKVRLLLAFSKLEYEEVVVDLLAGKHKSAEYLALNPLGQVPLLIDGDVTLRDSQAILVYLARRYSGETWLPSDPAQMGAIVQWLSFAANEIHNGAFLARMHFLFKVDLDAARAQAGAHAALKILNDRLSTREWLELDRPTIADLACFPYIGLVPEGKVSLDDYPHVRAWIDRIKAIPGYPSMPGLT